jgi:hypothetical protein
MGYASRSGRAVTNPEHPTAFGVCDRCGFWYNLHKLKYQYQWEGVQLVNLRYRVCRTCMDIPQPQLKARMAPPDPVPVWDPRPEQFAQSRYDPSYGAGGFIARSPARPLPDWIETEGGSPLEIE